jgi:hypothetical protein
MAENNKTAIIFGRALRAFFPDTEWYVPADHDEFVCLAYQKKFLSESQILEVDCDMIRKRDGVLFYMPDDYLSGGMQIEKQFSINHNKPMFDATADMLEYTERFRFALADWLERI